MGHRRACACYGPACREPFSKGDLRAFRPRRTGTHRQYFHPGCVEGGLGPIEEVEGAAALQPERLDELRPHCDQPGRPTRDEFLAAQRAKRRRTRAAPAARAGTAQARRHEDSDDDASNGLAGQDTQGDPDAATQALLNLGWWDGVAYDDLATDVRTLGRVPGPLTHSLALLRGAVATAFLSAVEAGDAEAAERAGKLHTFFDRILLFHPNRVRGGRSAKNQGGLTRVLTRRIRLAWRGDWGALWREANAAADAASTGRERRTTPKDTARAVEAFLADGLVSKALGLVTRSAPLVTEASAQPELQALFPAGTPATAGPRQPVDEETVNKLIHEVKAAIRRAPKRSGPGPNGSRFEHWQTLLDDVGALEANARVAVLLLLGALPDSYTTANLGARLLALRKKNGRLRPVACGSVVRRLAAKAACAVFQEEIKAACGSRQYAVSRQAGCELVHKCVSALAEALPSAAVLAFDASNAFNTIPRQNLLDAVARRAPALLGIANAWLTRETTHTYWPRDGAALPVRARTGVDQGCPLSPGLFAIGIADALSRADARLTHLHPSARIFSYLDDVVAVVPAGLAARACEIVQEELTAAGLTLNPDKTQAWTPAPGTALPQHLEARRVRALTVLGNPVPWYDRDDDEGDGRLPVHGTADGREVLDKTRRFLRHWRQLRDNGLTAEGAHTLLRTYALGCATHLLRANYETAWAAQLDDLLWGAYEEFAGFAFDASQREQAKLGLSDGGCAFPSARDAAARAYLGSWALVLPSVASCLGVTSLEGFRSRCPRIAQDMRSAEVELDAQGAKEGPIEWGSYLAEPRAKLQGYWGKRISAHKRAQLLQTLGEVDRLALRESSGTSAGSWLLPRQEGDPLIPDAHFHMGLRKRLRADVCAPGVPCQHRKRDGSVCGAPLDSKNWHPMKCG